MIAEEKKNAVTQVLLEHMDLALQLKGYINQTL